MFLYRWSPLELHARFLGDAIGSALERDHPDCEVIVVDGCSTDGSRAVIDGYFNFTCCSEKAV